MAITLISWMIVIVTNIHWHPSNSANIMLLPLSGHSHCAQMGVIGEELATLGHKVSAFVESRFNHTYCLTDSRIRLIYYNLDFKGNNSHKYRAEIVQLSLAGGASFLKLLYLRYLATKEACQALLSSDLIFKVLQNNRFDIALVDSVLFMRCYYLIPYKLSIPFVSLGTFVGDLETCGSFSPHLVPSVWTDYNNKMSLLQKIFNTAISLGMSSAAMLFYPKETFKNFAPELSPADIVNLITKSKLILDHSDVVLNYPKPLMPHHIQVGGLTARLPHHLPVHLEEFLRRDRGTIVVSFGSILKNHRNGIVEKFLTVFRKLDLNIIWSSDEDKEIGNIKMMKWIPQNDILGHKSTRLLISHCGDNSHFESLYHGIPVICFPVVWDQFYHAQRTKHHQVGLSFDIQTFTTKELMVGIQQILTNKTYTINMQQASKIFRDRPESPGQRAAKAIEHILKYNSSYLHTNCDEMPLYSFLLLDVWVTIIAFLVFFSFLFVYLMKMLCFKSYRKRKCIKTD